MNCIKNRVLLSLILILASGVSYAQSYVSKVSDAIAAFGDYGASFVVNTSGGAVAGSYQVAGDKFYLQLGDIKLYGDGDVRYQIDKAAESVIVDRVVNSPESGVLLDNPANAFDFAQSAYEELFISQSNGESTILLKGREDGAASMDNIVLIINDVSSLPCSITYTTHGDSIDIFFDSFEKISGSIHLFSQSNYPNYEIVDFR